MRYDIPRLVRARAKKGWDQTTLAYKTGFSVATICRVEGGQRQHPPTLKKIASALGLRMSDIVMDDEAYGDIPNPQSKSAKEKLVKSAGTHPRVRRTA